MRLVADKAHIVASQDAGADGIAVLLIDLGRVKCQFERDRNLPLAERYFLFGDWFGGSIGLGNVLKLDD